MGHTSGALRSRNFASSARGLRPDGKTTAKRLDGGEDVLGKNNRTSQAVLDEGCRWAKLGQVGPILTMGQVGPWSAEP
jgi:hypothetical protein